MPAKFFLPNAALQLTLERILEDTWSAFEQLLPNQIAITWILYEPPYRINTGGALSPEEFWQYRPIGASYRGVELIEPGGLVTLFYMVAMQAWLEQGMVPPSPEMERALVDMITGTSDDATGYIVDVLSGTTSGPELQSGPMKTWEYQRNIVNRYFQQLGWPELRAVNLNQKTWCDRPYGREYDFLGDTLENRNLLTSEATARLLHSIVGGVSISGVRSQQMIELMARSPRLDPKMDASGCDASELIAQGLPPTAKIWSKSGTAERVRHEAAYIEADGCHPYQLIVFTEGAVPSQHEQIIPFVSQQIFAASQAVFSSYGH
ncbi:MAG: serine hydrolase [Phormidesmis sp.]